MMRPPRVLHILKVYRPHFTGEGTFLERCAPVMQALAPEVEHDLLVTHTERPTDLGEAARCSALSHVYYLHDRTPTEAARHALLLAWMARHISRYDAVHVRTHADWYFLSYALVRLARRRLLLSATLDDSLPMLIGRYRPPLRPLARAGFHLFHSLVSISPRLHRETLGTGVDPERCHLVPCGITVPPPEPGRREGMRARIGVAPGELVILFVGGICDRKDPLSLVEAMPALLRQSPGARLVLVGPEIEPDYAVALRARARELGVAGCVHLVGEQPNPHPWFEAADIFAFASRLEGFGTVVPEAMAHGLPVVVRLLPGVNEDFVLEGETGFQFEESGGLERGLLRLAADPALRARMGRSGRALANLRFGMDVIARRWLALYGMGGRVRATPATTAPHLGITASLRDPGFHTPFRRAGEGGKPVLLTLVEAGTVNQNAPRPIYRGFGPAGAMASQHLAHRVLERYGAVPSYLTDHSVAIAEEGAAPLRELLAGGHAELGALFRSWVTPPFEDDASPTLPITQQFAKAERLTQALERAFGQHPLLWRGVGTLGPRTADILKRLGYLATSVEESAVTHRPHWADRERTLLCLPVSAAPVGPGGAVARLRLDELTTETAKRLIRCLYAKGEDVFVLSYHSTSLEPGRGPHIRTAEDLARFLDRLDEILAFFRDEVGGHCGRWRELYPALRRSDFAQVSGRGEGFADG